MSEINLGDMGEDDPLNAFFPDDASRAFVRLIMEGQVEQARGMVSRGFELDQIYPTGFCLLTFFMYLRHLEAFQLLLDLGASPDFTAPEMQGKTPLMLSVGIPEIDFLRSCLKAGGSVEHQSDDGDSALILAAAGGNETAVRLLLAHGANVNQQGAMKTTALHEAAKEGYRSIVDLLQAAGANADLKDEYDETARQLLAA